VTLATQSAGCEEAERLGETPVILFHGERDELLPPQASELVQMLTGGELVVFPDTGHLLSEVADDLRDRLGRWIPARFS
jgi:pimeloyl-ACP methyl ester carboxylesterase